MVILPIIVKSNKYKKINNNKYLRLKLVTIKLFRYNFN